MSLKQRKLAPSSTRCTAAHLSAAHSQITQERCAKANWTIAGCYWAEKSPKASDPIRLTQRRRFFVAAFELEHHPFDVLVVLVRLEELQTLLRTAPL
jgi:hypothetical protein